MYIHTCIYIYIYIYTYTDMGLQGFGLPPIRVPFWWFYTMDCSISDLLGSSPYSGILPYMHIKGRDANSHSCL